MGWMLLTLYLLKMLHWKMLAIMKSLVPTELDTVNPELNSLSSQRSHPSQHHLQTLPQHLDLLLHSLLSLLVYLNLLSNGTKVTKFYKKARGECLRKSLEMKEQLTR